MTIAASEEDSQDQLRPIAGAEFPLADAVLAYQTKPVRGKAVLRVE